LIYMGETWKKETSAGGVVYKKNDNNVFILLIEPKSPNFGPPAGYWTFPKGLVDEGEDVKVTAVREVREEGGVNAEVEQELGYIRYFRKSEAFGNAIKFVHFYLMKYVDGDPNDHDNEIANADWFELDDVLGKLKYSHDKDIFKKASEQLK
jgi:8-oxo-dGTP diphosphatase